TRARRHLPKDLVSRHVTEQVVDELEAVEIDVSEADAALPGRRDRALEMRIEAATIEEASERVVVGKELQPPLGFLASGHILDPGLDAALLAQSPHVQPATPAFPGRDRDLGIGDPALVRLADERFERVLVGHLGPAL